MNIQVSSNFRKMNRKAVFAILLFILTYIILLSIAIGFAALCVAGGITLILLKPSFITIAGGLGLASLGIFILIFLLKFFFKKHAIDRNHLIEITQHDEPKLFAFINEIVQEVETNFPKRVYLSSDVNASVFYDSNFWSMLLPIRKNLQIGVGLINTVTEQEFKAILVHEFGHFSQRSMKVGSYVYNVNQVIFNLLYENETFEKIIHNWAKISGLFSFFISIAVKIIQGFQWILKKMYAIVNINYLALSREMEFHADEIAANVAGYLPLKESLLRLDLADYSFNSVLDYYNRKISDNIISKNVFKEQSFVMNYLANENLLSFKNTFPLVTELDLSKYNKSRLTIKDQWASHPTIEERIKALEETNISKPEAQEPANLLFVNTEKIQEEITAKLFSAVSYNGNTVELELEKFQDEYIHTSQKYSLPKEYNSYYDNKQPLEFDVNILTEFDVAETIDTLFKKENVDMVYDFIAYENDKNLLTDIANKTFKIKSFDYDGIKYKSKEASYVIQTIENNEANTKERILQNDINIYKFFMKLADKKGNASLLKEKYINFFQQNNAFERRLELFYVDTYWYGIY